MPPQLNGQRSTQSRRASPASSCSAPSLDPAGRFGLAIAIDDHGIRFPLIFDAGNSALLAEEHIALTGNKYGYPAGTRVGYSTYLVQKIVNSDTATS